MRLKFGLSFVFAALVLTLASQSFAGTYTFTPSPADLNDLDHHSAYTWRVDNVSASGLNLSTQTIVSATLTFKNISNWDNNANNLYIHLLNTAINSGVASYIDDPNDNVFYDNFLSSNPLVASGTANTYITTIQNLNMTGHDINITFTGAQLTALTTYIANGNNFALGFDPDCHYYNDGVSLTINTQLTSQISQVPEPASMTLLGTGLIGLGGFIRRRVKK